MENGAVTGKAYMAVTVGTMNSQMAAQYSIDIDQGVFVYSVVKGRRGRQGRPAPGRRDHQDG